MAEIKTILFPTDFSDFSNKSFPYAATLASAFGAKIVMLHVAELEEEDPANPAHSFPALDAFGGEIATERIVIRGHAPYKDILDVSRSRNCDLIVMSTHGRSALSQFFLGGSVAEDVARLSAVPVFIVKIEQGEPAESYGGRLKEILFATDLSSASQRALPLARLFADKFNAKLHALHVIDDEERHFYDRIGLDLDDPDLMAKAGEALRGQFTVIAGAEGAAEFHYVRGRSDQEIVRFADSHGIDLIVISAHGHGGVREEVIGTTTDRVIRRAHCPVLAARS
jgi:nucleotide-binding universal stress UspA family protein